MKSNMNLIYFFNYNPVTLSCNSSLNATLSKFRPQYTQEPEVKQFSFNHLIKEEKDQEKILRTPVTATRTGYEFHVGNNGEANQSKYPMELRARLTRQNLQYCMYNTLRYKVLYYWCLYNICTDVSKTLSNNRLSPLTQRFPHYATTPVNNPLTHIDTLHYYSTQ